VQLGQRRCLSVAGKRIDETIAAEMLRAVAPMAIEAAEEAERMLRDEDQERRRIAELELQQAQYDASLAERRYAACDPDNRLIAAQLEKAWETALQRVERCRERLDQMPVFPGSRLVDAQLGMLAALSRKRAPGPMAARGDSLGCSRSPESNLYAGLFAPSQ
jgi:hypothetical protein